MMGLILHGCCLLSVSLSVCVCLSHCMSLCLPLCVSLSALLCSLSSLSCCLSMPACYCLLMPGVVCLSVCVRPFDSPPLSVSLLLFICLLVCSVCGPTASHPLIPTIPFARWATWTASTPPSPARLKSSCFSPSTAVSTCRYGVLSLSSFPPGPLIPASRFSPVVQGYATMKTAASIRGDVAGASFIYPDAATFGLEWRALFDMHWSTASHLTNKLNEHKEVKVARDMQEVDPETGNDLLVRRVVHVVVLPFSV